MREFTRARVPVGQSCRVRLGPDGAGVYGARTKRRRGGATPINTEGSSFDTEIGLYTSLGALVVSDDDAGELLTSAINPTLDAGTYYLAVAGFSTSFGARFNVTPGTANGSLVINGLSIPEPTTLALVAGAAAFMLKRRRH